MKFMCFDIETVPQARFLDPDVYRTWSPINGTLDLDHDWVEEHGSATCDRLVRQGDGKLKATGVVPALHATTCHIVQVSFGWRAPMGNHTAELHRKALQSNDYFAMSLTGVQEVEAALVAGALDSIAGACQKGSTIVSFNGKQFDIPILRARAALLRLNVSRLPWRRLLYPYSDDQHADLRLILGADDRRARGTLQWWADAFGIHAEEHGAEVGAWVRAGEWDKLRAYGECEAKTLVELYEAVERVL